MMRAEMLDRWVNVAGWRNDAFDRAADAWMFTQHVEPCDHRWVAMVEHPAPSATLQAEAPLLHDCDQPIYILFLPGIAGF